MEIAALIIASLIGFSIGTAFGALFLSKFTQNAQTTHELEKHLHDKQDEIKHYQQEVRQHFSETAGLLRGLAENYRDVHNHLAQGAEQLCPDPQADLIIKKLPEVDTIEVSQAPESVSPPLDYAPKITRFDKSVLNEEYDLEKISLNKAVNSEEIAELVASTNESK